MWKAIEGGPGAASGRPSAIQLRAGLGAAAYSLDDTRIGGVLAEAEAVVFPVPYLGILSLAH
jgi:hypothetical protein